MSYMTDFRPKNFDELVGHDQIKKTLKSKLSKDNHPHCFILSGDSGVGKTTVARIISYNVNASIVEVDAGNATKVENMREVISDSKHINIMGKRLNKLYVIDECHMLSKSSWNALLKTLEEPSKSSYFVFCTTELNKIPKTVRTRCLEFVFKSLSSNEIKKVINNTGVEIDKSFIDVIAKNSNGSARAALVLLEKAVECDSIDDLNKVVNEVSNESNLVIEISRELINKSPSTDKVLSYLKEYEGSYESARIVIFNFITSCVFNNPGLVNRLSWFESSITSETTGKGELVLKILNSLND